MSARPETLMLAAVVIPFAAALAIPLFRRAPNPREAVTLVAAAALFLAVLSLLPSVLGGARPEWAGVTVLPGVAFAFAVEPLGMLFALVASALWIVNSIYSIGYMRAHDEPRQTGYYVCFAVALGSTIGLAFAKNLFTLFLFYEALTISTYPLVAHHRDAEAMRSGRLYLLLLLGTSMVLFLPAIAATYVLAGTTDFAAGGILSGKASGALLTVLLLLFVFGIGKAALMPLHFWLPAAMVAPTPVSALLHAVAVVKAGVFTVVKVIVLIFGVETLSASGQSGWLTAVAGITVVVASLVALKQDNLKRRLAYSTVSQLAYVVLGAAILTPISVIGAVMHIAAHAVGKITLFFAAGSIQTAAHLTEVSQLDGIGRRMPWTMGAFAVGALGMIGLPPTAGFLGKWFMLAGAMQTENWLAVAVMVVSTVLNAGYFLPIVFRAFLRAPPTPEPGHGAAQERAPAEAPWPIVAALTATALGVLALFFLPDVPLALARMTMGR
ncbi:MAG: monovalent cation/H+ antiporter subunit D family protein [Alphaproteobacteria bacterium]|nr:monovalent cation/H+ antiporter subunit D family protein [Alphaproteobacteria bacterium]